MGKHIIQILETVGKLNAIGETIKDFHVSALSLSYDTLLTAFEA